jgi:hypothetical protein
MQRGFWGVVLVGLAASGCSTTCSWFGRNSDCSNNCVGKKPTPVQQGPIAGTYTQPGNATTAGAPLNYQQQNMMTSPQQTSMLPGQTVSQPNQQVPVYTTTPASSPMPASPLNTPLAPPPTSSLAPGGPISGMPVRQLPPSEYNPNPPANATAQTLVRPPEVPAPPIDLTVPGTAAKKTDLTDPANKPSQFPLVLGPNDNRGVRNEAPTIPAPNIPAPPTLTPPSIPLPNTTPNTISTEVPSTPPPLSMTPPAPPRLN